MSHELDGKLIFDAKLYEDVSSIKREGDTVTSAQKKTFIIVIVIKSGKGIDILRDRRRKSIVNTSYD